MKINILSPDQGIDDLKGFTVVVDVFRAFSTACYMFMNNPKTVLVVDSIDDAYSIKAHYQNTILVGERNGLKIDGFDYGNSPTEVFGKDFSDKIVVHTTSAGTKGLLRQPVENEVITGSFVNAKAIVRFILKSGIDHINLYCTADRGELLGEEDYLFADYIKNELLGIGNNYASIVKRLRNGSGKGFKEGGFAPESDFWYCMDLGICNSILHRKTQSIYGNYIELKAEVIN